MRICIDNCVFINGLTEGDPAVVRLLSLVGPDLVLVIPCLVVQEVARNLQTPEQGRRFMGLSHQSPFAFLVDDLVPRAPAEDYVHKGLPEKTNAFIGAFAGWMQARYLISDNWHFLRDLQTTAFQVRDPAQVLALWEAGSA
jgi:hypothetical protein